VERSDDTAHTPPPEAGDSGYASVTTAGLLAALVAVMLTIAAAIGHVAERHIHQVAADLAAVAAAQALWSPTQRDPCTSAHQVADAHGISIDTCTIDGLDVIVRTSRAQSRAGPIEDATQK